MPNIFVLALQPAPAGTPAVSGTAQPTAPVSAPSAPANVAGMPAGATPTATTPSASGGTGAAQTGAAPMSNPLTSFMLPMLVVMVVLILFSTMAGRKERRKRAELMNSLAVGDKVQTLGGIIGHIAEIRDDEVVLRVDEVTNTRIKFARSAVQSVLRKGSEKPGSSAEAKPAGVKILA